jgi:Rad3-related DNA helicase
LARKALPIYTNLCQRKPDGQWSQCPYFVGCEYIQMRRAAYSAPFVILVHAHLSLEWGATAAERLS